MLPILSRAKGKLGCQKQNKKWIIGRSSGERVAAVSVSSKRFEFCHVLEGYGQRLWPSTTKDLLSLGGEFDVKIPRSQEEAWIQQTASVLMFLEVYVPVTHIL